MLGGMWNEMCVFQQETCCLCPGCVINGHDEVCAAGPVFNWLPHSVLNSLKLEALANSLGQNVSSDLWNGERQPPEDFILFFFWGGWLGGYVKYLQLPFCSLGFRACKRCPFITGKQEKKIPWKTVRLCLWKLFSPFSTAYTNCHFLTVYKIAENPGILLIGWFFSPPLGSLYHCRFLQGWRLRFCR